jgi:hypothetical protein
MAINVLIVLDGDRWTHADKSPTEEDFTLQVLHDALFNSASPQFAITRAHRRSDPTPGVLTDFNFKMSVPDLNVFDVILMIGDEGDNGGQGYPDPHGPLDPDENQAIANFMEKGGGVFAVGDHDGLGSEMCGALPRVRSMRFWFSSYPANMPPVLPPAGVPPNLPVAGPTRGDTLRPAPDGKYYFDSQSDAKPQTLILASPVHPILKGPSGPITSFPDHMHEGNTTVGWPGFDWNGSVSLNGQSFEEYPTVDGNQEKPRIIATGNVIGGHITLTESDYDSNIGGDGNDTVAATINTLCAYDGRTVGKGRVVTGSSFHHYMDINLTGDPIGSLESGADTQAGFNVPAAMDVLDGMKAFYINMAQWLARAPRTLTFVVDKSTFGQDEVSVQPAGTFDSAVFVIVDGMRPEDFPSGPINAGPFVTQWAPQIPPPGPGVQVLPTGVTSDAPGFPARIQRFTFAYKVVVDKATAFGFGSSVQVYPIQASLVSDPAPPNATAAIELIKAADPFFDNLGDGNTTSWLSADVRVFPVVQGGSKFGVGPLGPTADDARTFIRDLAAGITSAQFTSMPHGETDTGSEISLLPTTTPTMADPIPKPVYNFALARVRLTGAAENASTVRVFFRLFQSQTTASLTYQLDGMGNPIDGYRQTSGPPDSTKISLPGISADGSEYISIPCFDHSRVTGVSLTTQHDGNNVKPVDAPGAGSETFVFFGCLLDNNLTGDPAYLPATPMGQANINGPFSGTLKTVTQLLTGAHQCIVAEIVYDEAPIINGATPSTSDKIAQRNIAFTTIENPGGEGSRVAAHTFEIRPTQTAVDDDHRPDELMIDWQVPAGTTATIYLPGTTAHDVLALAEKFYATPGLSAVDANTLQCPVGGITYIPIPKGGNTNYAGLIAVEFPRGVRKGQRYDVVVRQITNAGFQVPGGRVNTTKGAKAAATKRKHAEHAATVTYARRHGANVKPEDVIVIHQDGPSFRASEELVWRRVLGAFQIAVPVDTRDKMLVPEQRLLSVLRWIAETLPGNSRWYPVFMRYLDKIAGRVRGLGGDPNTIPPTPTGLWPGLIPGLEPLHPGHPTHPPGHPGHGPHGGPLHPLHHGGEFTGKIEGVAYDRFGDFEGFILETRSGAFHRFDSRETRVRDVVNRAWAERIVVTVITDAHEPHRVASVILHGAPSPLEP